jgi:hypothetical protein
MYCILYKNKYGQELKCNIKAISIPMARLTFIIENKLCKIISVTEK